MPRNRGTFPYPLLDSSNDVSSEFRVPGFEIESTTTTFDIRFDVILDDVQMAAMLDREDTKLVLYWNCSPTFQSGHIQPEIVRRGPTKTTYKCLLRHEDIADVVQLEVRIIANRDIPDYRLERQHEDYGSSEFSVLHGDILGIGGGASVSVDKIYDPMAPPFESCFVFRPHDDIKAGIEVQFSQSEHVIVWMDRKLHGAFNLLSDDPDFQVATVMLPALMQTLSEMNTVNAQTEYADFRWYAALKRLLSIRRVESEIVLVQAQRLLENPISRAVRKHIAATGSNDEQP